MPRPSRRRCRPPRAGARHRRAGGRPPPGRRPRRRRGRARPEWATSPVRGRRRAARRTAARGRPARGDRDGSPRAASESSAGRSAGSIALSERFVIGVISPSWSISWSAPRPSCARGTPPPRRSSGAPPDQAFATAVAVFVTPGPAVTSTTPVRPLTRAHAWAMWPAVSSWRTSTRRMPISWHASTTGVVWPPTSVNTVSIPAAASARATSRPPVIRRARRRSGGCGTRPAGLPCRDRERGPRRRFPGAPGPASLSSRASRPPSGSPRASRAGWRHERPRGRGRRARSPMLGRAPM